MIYVALPGVFALQGVHNSGHVLTGVYHGERTAPAACCLLPSDLMSSNPSVSLSMM